MVAFALVQTGALGYGVPVHTVADADELDAGVEEMLTDDMLVEELETDVGPIRTAKPTDGLLVAADSCPD